MLSCRQHNHAGAENTLETAASFGLAGSQDGMCVASEDGKREPLKQPSGLAWFIPDSACYGPQVAEEGEGITAEHPRCLH